MIQVFRILRLDQAIDFSQTVAEGEGAEIFDVSMPFSPRNYFQIVTPEGGAILAERRFFLPRPHGGRKYSFLFRL